MTTEKENKAMKPKISSILLLPAIVMTAALTLTASGQDTQPKKAAPLTAERTILVSITAKVEAIDPAKREVTLKGPLGNVVTFVVDQRVKRLNEVKVGDEVTADYYVSL